MKKFIGSLSTIALVGISILGVVPTVSAHTKVATETITVTIEPGSKLGPDKIKHDAFVNANFNLKKGEPALRRK